MLEVVDHGEGIPPQIREKIFQRFWRADTSRTRETGGSGPRARDRRRRSSPRTTASSTCVETPGGGATFRCHCRSRLAAARSASAAEPTSPESHRADAACAPPPDGARRPADLASAHHDAGISGDS